MELGVSMRRTIGLLFVVCAIALVSISPVTAITNHNLHWGFEVGDQFHYSISGQQYITITDYYVEIDEVPTLPEDIHYSMDLSYHLLIYSVYYENGTEFEYNYLTLYWIALPIGNWSFVQELIGENPYSETTIINTATEWGMTSSSEFGGMTQTATIKFSKADGVLNLYSIVVEPDEGETQSTIITRKGLGGIGSVSLPALLIGGGSGIIIVVFVVLIYKERH
jgi:hypothetical protein